MYLFKLSQSPHGPGQHFVREADGRGMLEEFQKKPPKLTIWDQSYTLYIYSLSALLLSFTKEMSLCTWPNNLLIIKPMSMFLLFCLLAVKVK